VTAILDRPNKLLQPPKAPSTTGEPATLPRQPCVDFSRSPRPATCGRGHGAFAAEHHR